MRIITCVLIALCVLAVPTSASALSGASLLGFGATYVTASGEQRVHRGIDVTADAGDAVEAPIAGTVVFAGRVPGPEGGTVLALSIDTDAGRVTLLPLAEVRAAKGERVAEGASVGTVAAEGDPSSRVPHVHVSLRAGDLYLDPAPLLLPAPTVEQQPQAPQPQSVPAPTAAKSTVAQAAVLVAPDRPAVEIGAASDRAPSSADAPVLGSSGDTVGSGASTPVMQQGVSLVPELPVAPPASIARTDVLGAAMRFAARIARNPAALASILFALLVCAFVLTRRAFERAVVSDTPVSHRLGKMLQQLRAGDTLCGLISCPGHDAFTVPGPPAQRR